MNKKIKSAKWMLGVRSGDTILLYSLRCRGENEYIEKLYGKKFSQWRMLVPKENYNVRAIGLNQAKKFHNESKKTIFKKPGILKEKIKEDERIARELILMSRKIKSSDQILKLAEIAKKHYFLFFLCVSYGIKLFENIKKIKDKKAAKESLRIHDKWRNSIFKKEEKVLININGFLKKTAKRFKLRSFRDLFYLEAKEFELVMKNGLKSGFKKEIEKRKRGFLYLFINGNSKIITEPKVLKEFENYFKQTNKHLKGMVAFKKEDKLKGIVQVVKDPNQKIQKGKIMIVLQTAPAFIPIVKKFSAIIAEEGGITSHAAIVAREFKIPCIVGAKNVTKVLKNGDNIEMDFNKGIVKILK